jgi:hypothetical protein
MTMRRFPAIRYFTMMAVCDAASIMSEMSQYPAIFAGTWRVKYISYSLLPLFLPT